MPFFLNYLIPFPLYRAFLHNFKYLGVLTTLFVYNNFILYFVSLFCLMAENKAKCQLLVYFVSSEFSLSSFLELVLGCKNRIREDIWFLELVHAVSLTWTLMYLGLGYGQPSMLASKEKSCSLLFL